MGSRYRPVSKEALWGGPFSLRCRGPSLASFAPSLASGNAPDRSRPFYSTELCKSGEESYNKSGFHYSTRTTCWVQGVGCTFLAGAPCESSRHVYCSSLARNLVDTVNSVDAISSPRDRSECQCLCSLSEREKEGIYKPFSGFMAVRHEGVRTIVKAPEECEGRDVRCEGGVKGLGPGAEGNGLDMTVCPLRKGCCASQGTSDHGSETAKSRQRSGAARVVLSDGGRTRSGRRALRGGRARHLSEH